MLSKHMILLRARSAFIRSAFIRRIFACGIFVCGAFVCSAPSAYAQHAAPSNAAVAPSTAAVGTIAAACFPENARQYFPAGLTLGYGGEKPALVEGKADTATLVPLESGAQALAASLIGADKKDRLRIEAMAVLPRPAFYKPAAHAEAAASELAVLAGILNAVSSMQDLEYWSASRKAWRTLYAASYRLDSPKTKKHIDDMPGPTPNAIPSTWNYYAFQRDLTFGSNIYRFDLRATPQGLSVVSSNVTSLNIMVFSAVSPGDMQAGLVVLPANDGILVYAVTVIKAADAFKERVYDSVGNRAFALLWWFSQRVQAAGLALAPAERPIAAR